MLRIAKIARRPLRSSGNRVGAESVAGVDPIHLHEPVASTDHDVGPVAFHDIDLTKFDSASRDG